MGTLINNCSFTRSREDLSPRPGRTPRRALTGQVHVPVPSQGPSPVRALYPVPYRCETETLSGNGCTEFRVRLNTAFYVEDFGARRPDRENRGKGR